MAGRGVQERLWRGEACRSTKLLHTHTIKNNVYIHTTTPLHILVLHVIHFAELYHLIFICVICANYTFSQHHGLQVTLYNNKRIKGHSFRGISPLCGLCLQHI